MKPVLESLDPDNPTIESDVCYYIIISNGDQKKDYWMVISYINILLHEIKLDFPFIDNSILQKDNAK